MKNGIWISLLLLVGCATFVEQSPPLQVSFGDERIIRVTGKGSGAGMALMSSMGPMGVAIGVAIDEGIAKGIRTSFFRDYTWQTYTNEQLKLATSNIEFTLHNDLELKNSLKVDAIEFKISGNDDLVSIKLKARYVDSNLNITEFVYPRDIKVVSKQQFKLENLNKFSSQTVNLINSAISQIVQCIELKDNCQVSQ